MSAAEWIAERRKEQGEAYDCAEAYRALPKALDALEAVLEAHHATTNCNSGQVQGCADCADVAPSCADCWGDYPCPTVEAIEVALRGES